MWLGRGRTSRDSSVSASLRSSPSHSLSISFLRSTARHSTRCPRLLLLPVMPVTLEADNEEEAPRRKLMPPAEDGWRAERRGAAPAEVRTHAAAEVTVEAAIMCLCGVFFVG